jgi:hypothetical protein
MHIVNGSSLLVSSFVALALLVAAGFVWAVRVSGRSTSLDRRTARRRTLVAAVAVAGWLAVTAIAGASGRLSFESRPPTMPIIMIAGLVLAVVVSTSRLGRQLATGLPLAALVGAQAFRFPLELMLHRAYVEGLMPVQMSFSGFNLDILTGLSAVVVAIALANNPRRLVVARIWNTAGIVLLVNIVTIAVLSAPTPIRVFRNEPANVFITRAPRVWLPTVFVVAAIVGQILVYRRLKIEAARVESSRASADAILPTDTSVPTRAR